MSSSATPVVVGDVYRALFEAGMTTLPSALNDIPTDILAVLKKEHAEKAAAAEAYAKTPEGQMVRWIKENLVELSDEQRKKMPLKEVVATYESNIAALDKKKADMEWRWRVAHCDVPRRRAPVPPVTEDDWHRPYPVSKTVVRFADAAE